MGLMYFIFRTFVHFEEDHKSRPYNIDTYIHRVTVHLWEDNFKMDDK